MTSTTVSSQLDSVTLYREGAICRRLATASGPHLSTELRLPGLPLSLEPGSLRARVLQGKTRVLDVRAAFDVQLAEEIDRPTEQKALEQAEAEFERVQGALGLVRREVEELQALRPKPLELKRGEPPREAHVAAALALADFVEARLTPLMARQRALEKDREHASDQVQLRQRRIAEASTSNRTQRAKLSRVAVVTLSEPATEPLQLALEYQVRAARWAPSYQLRLAPGYAGGQLTMRAAVAQATGEDWVGVNVALSTASLDRRTDAPELKSLRIGRSQAEPPRSGWREPPEGLDALFDGYDSAVRSKVAPTFGGPATPPADSSTIATMRSTSELKKDKSRAEPERELVRSRGRAPTGTPMNAAMSLGGSGMPPPAPPPPGPAMKPKPASAQRSMPGRSMAAPTGIMKKSAALRLDDAAPQNDADDAPSEGAAEMADEALAEPEFDEFAKAREPAGPAAGFLDYDRLAMSDADGSGGPRGRLAPAPDVMFAFGASVQLNVEVVMALVALAQNRVSALFDLPLPPRCIRVAAQDQFDYRYECAGRLDIPSTAEWTTITVMNCKVGLKLQHVTVPSVEPKVFRTLRIDNATTHALLPGPVDVSAGDEFLMTTSLPAIPPGDATQRLGLGVEEAIKVARKTNFKETAGGFLGGSTVLPHEIEIEVSNRLAVPAEIEVRERIPVPSPNENDVKVEEAEVRPAWEKLEGPIDGVIVAGARRWKVTVPNGQKTVLTAQYTIRIPADQMLVGGNRRV